jgi:hypothetical protein
MRVDPIVEACCAVNPAARATAASVVAALGARAEFDELDAETRSEALAVAVRAIIATQLEQLRAAAPATHRDQHPEN